MGVNEGVELVLSSSSNTISAEINLNQRMMEEVVQLAALLAVH